MRNDNIKKMVLSALLCAIGIIIPMFSPLRIILEPASFTLGSHVAIFIAVFISPGVAVAVSLGTAAGFFLGGFPIVIVLRAFSHVVFALAAAVVLQKRPGILTSFKSSQLFSFCIALIHAVCEVAVASAFYFSNNMSEGYYSKGFFSSVMLLVGAGTVVHSMIDFAIAQFIWRTLKKIS